MRKFDTRTQELKYKVLKEVATLAFEDNLSESYYAIPRLIVPDNGESMRCCIYKDRAIVEEMVRGVLGASWKGSAAIDVLDIACDECPIERYTVSEGCRGCISHRCMDSCPVDAIRVRSNKQVVIDRDKCIECGKCFKACPFGAIREQIRPCIRACKIKAIQVDKDWKAVIDHDKCVSCGMCMIKCPFGAIQDRAFILDTISLLKQRSGLKPYKVHAIVAPSIAGQFEFSTIEQMVTALKMLGFATVSEVAVGADITAYKDAHELAEKGALMSSCCPSFVAYVEQSFPHMAKYISENASPMVECAKLIKDKDPDCKIVFIGPCISKKQECRMPRAGGYVDNVITFEELQALVDSREIIVSELAPTAIDSASYYGRVFARAGGVTEAVKHVIEADGLDIQPNIIAADGLDNIKIAMLKNAKGLPFGTFIEGMACSGGCINGSGCVNHDVRNIKAINAYSAEASQDVMLDNVRRDLNIEKK